MSTTSENNKRIAKNTALLYIRMIFLMAVTLYTSRVILQMLGVTDFGIYSVVGGVVSMLGFMSGSLSGATSRFITFELGRGKDGNVKTVFRCAASIHYVLAGIILLLAETIGLWFVMQKLVIPPERMMAALWVYQCSVLTFIVSIISAPYNALIIAHERMGAFAYISIFETIVKLLVVISLAWSVFDRLATYAVLLLVVQVVVRLVYTLYCNRHFPETDSRWMWNKELSRKMFVYTGWTLNGNLAVIGYTQGINILLNLFFGPAVNAARGFAVQVQAAVNQFFSNFQMAVRPQIVKSYAQDNLVYMHKLILVSSRYSFFLILLISFPLLVNTEYILQLWLGEVPAHTVAFTRLMVLACMNYALSQPTIMAIHATGDLKKFQLIEGSMLLMVIPIAYLLLKYARISPESVFIVYLVIETVTQLVRVWIVYPRVRLAKRKYITEVLWPIAKVCLPLLPAGWYLYQYTASSWTGLLASCMSCLVCTVVMLSVFGLKTDERRFISGKIVRYITPRRKHEE